MTHAERVDCLVIGAGVIGLAVARRLAQAGREVIVLESHPGIGMETSSRNSEVIHAGIYYAPGSLKARLCVAGKHQLYDYCAERGIEHRRTGKIIVATQAGQEDALETILARAAEAGVEDLRRLSKQEIREREPEVEAIEGLLSPSTGIVDSHALMLNFQGDLESCGGAIAFNCPVLGGRIGRDRLEVDVGGSDPMTLSPRLLINTAGLRAVEVANGLVGFPHEHLPRQYYAKGHYFELSRRSSFSHLVYPVPGDGGLGVHVTLDLAGRARFGPDVQWIEKPDYTFDESRREAFAKAIREYFPSLDDEALQPGYTGIRPKLVGEGAPAADFMISMPDEHGVAGVVNLFGIESPGLTASMAIADCVAARLDA